MIVWKAIKPARFDDKAFTRAMNKAAKSAASDIKGDFEKTTKYWRHKPVFEKVVQIGPNAVAVLVGTDDEIYGYVDGGTKPHVIRATRAKMLRFLSEYRAHTQPRVLESGRGGARGKAIYRKEVMHPGTEAREFDKLISEKWKDAFKRRMEQAMKEGRQQCGHAR